MLRQASALGSLLVDLIYPPRCSVCEATGAALCNACLESIAPAPAAPPPLPLKAMLVAGAHRGALREAILRYKYQRDLSLLTPLAGLLATAVSLADDPWPPEALAPIPLHWRRRWWRSFDQAQLLAEAVGRATGIETMLPLRRVRSTRSQARLNAAQRAENVASAFALRPGAAVQGRRIALVDDVFTTGATLAAAAKPLLAAGAAAVYGLVLSHDGD